MGSGCVLPPVLNNHHLLFSSAAAAPIALPWCRVVRGWLAHPHLPFEFLTPITPPWRWWWICYGGGVGLLSGVAANVF
ncbi:unnamed protein product [Prunus armeniaca]